MKIKNRLKAILDSLGLVDYKPSDELLKLLGMTRKRFFQILNNSGLEEMSVLEVENIEAWLSKTISSSIDTTLIEKKEAVA